MEIKETEKFVVNLLTSKLPASLYYHNLEHTMDVVQAAENLAALEGITQQADKFLLRTAALLHDCGFAVNYSEHETEGCILARIHLPGWGYSNGDIDSICGMIMATRMPQQPDGILEKILCDADLDYLGRDDFDSISRKLFREWQARGKNYSENEWNKVQTDFLASHRYWTSSADRLRGKPKQEHLKKIRAKLKK